MPIQGLPDAAIHCLCIRCRRWHEPHEGIFVRPTRAGGILGAAASAAVLAAGLAPEAAKRRFLCHSCRRKLLYWRILLYTLALAAAMTVVLLNR